MATIGRAHVRPVRTISGNSPETVVYPEAASQAFKRGEPVHLVNGLVTECGNDPGVILGYAAQDASGVTNTDIRVWLENGDTIFSANVYHSSDASAVTAQTIVGKRYGVYRDTTNSRMYIDISSTTVRVLIIKLHPADAVGDKYGRVLFQAMPNYRQVDNTS